MNTTRASNQAAEGVSEPRYVRSCRRALWRGAVALGAMAQLGVFVGVAQPAISDIPDQKTQINTALGPVPFQVSGLDTGSALFSITGQSGNAALVEDAKIVIQAAGTDWSVVVTPVMGQTGKTTITITATDGTATVSDAFELLVNSPVRLTRNDGLLVDQGGSAPITVQELSAEDLESPPAQIFFNIAPGGQGGSARFGQLLLNGQPVLAGQSFTLEDLMNGLIRYTHDGSYNFQDDFVFNVTDADGGATPTGQYTTYTFRIGVRFINKPPTALDGSVSTGLAQTYTGALPAADPDPGQTLAFRLLSNGSKGVAVLTDSKTGAFTYTPNWGERGEDSFTFQVNDGIVDAPSPGTLTITIRPATLAGAGKTFENVAFTGTLGATNPFPPHTLTFRLTDSGPKGTAVLADASTGAFTFTPAPGAIGTATITYVVNDGYLDSLPGTFTLTLWPKVDAGDILVTSKPKLLVFVDPASGEQFVLSSGGFFDDPRGMAMEASGDIVVIDNPGGVIRVNLADGSQSLVCAGMNFSTAPLGPISIALEADGSMLVADGVNGLKRVNPVTGHVAVVSSGGDLALAGAVAVGASGEIFASDYSGLMPEGTSKVLRVDPATGEQTVISTGGYLLLPAGMAFDADGRLIVADVGAPLGKIDRVFRIDPATGEQSLLAEGGDLDGTVGIAQRADGTLLVTSTKHDALFSLDPATGALSTLTESNHLDEPAGLLVARLIAQQPPRFSPPALAGGDFAARLTGLSPGNAVVIEASADLRIWAAVLTNAPGATEFEYVVPAADHPARFFRAILRP